MGTLYASRRQPTPDEIKRINDSLAAMEKGADASATASAPAKPAPGPKAEAEGGANTPG